MTKQSRKDLLKREDAFVLAAEEGANWVSKHQKTLLMAVAAVAVLGICAWGGTAFLQQRSRDTASIFAQGFKIWDEGVVHQAPAEVEKGAAEKTAAGADKAAAGEKKASATSTDAPSFASEKAKWQAAREKFQAVLERRGHRDVGVMAALLVGDLDTELGDLEHAEETFAALQKLTPDDSLFFLAAERLAYLRERRGDVPGALAALDGLAGDTGRFYADRAQLHQARLYLRGQDKEPARKILEQFEKSFPNSQLAETARTQLAELADAVPQAATQKVAE